MPLAHGKLGPMDVLGSTRYVVDRSRSVRTDVEAVARWAAAVRAEDISLPTQPHELAPAGEPDEVANFVLLVDCLNFCFWADPPWVVTFRGRAWHRYYALLACLARAVEEDPAWKTARKWAAAGRDEVRRVFRGQGEIPLLDHRVAIINETGRVLLERYDGRVLNLVRKAGADAVEIARTLAREFPSFCDCALYEGRTVWFLKRSQICAADLAVAMRASGGPTITGLDRLTAFADYRLPQVLRHLGILRLAGALESRVEAREEIPAGTPEEVELRAHTIWAVELMHRALHNRRIDRDVWMIDEYLWHRSHDEDVRVRHHRTRTVFY